MNPTRITTLLAIALVPGVGVWLGLQVGYAQLPPLPWSGLLTLGVLALGVLVTTVNTRARLRRRPGTRPIDPLVVARLAVFAKASAYTAAVAAGAFAGVLVFVAPELARGVGRHDALVSGVTLVAALFLAAVALLLEHACRVPRSPDEQERSPGRRR